MGALGKRGLKVQPFKTGPDYIDPTYHTKITGVPSRNLDTWLLAPEAILEFFHRAMTGRDIAVIEGVMGLYDGRSPTNDEGSTAELAKLLKAPVLLAVDSRKGARSLAALVAGYRDFDAALDLRGVVLNGIGSEGHLRVCREAIEHYTALPVLGYLPRDERLTLPERHLGLVPTVEGGGEGDVLARLVTQCEATLDIPRILRLSEEAAPPETAPGLFPPRLKAAITRIAVARDRAFSFYYQDSLDLLEAWGAEIVSFSPLEDGALPPETSGIHLGGGFPELYAAELAANVPMRAAIKQAAAQGMPVYAECGGLMYLGESIGDFAGNEYAMVGALPLTSRIDSPRLSLGYRTVRALRNGPLLRRGESVRGHEFHWSVLKSGAEGANAYRVTDRGNCLEGFQDNNLLASYVHLHLGSRPGMAQRFIENCRKFQGKLRQL
ncbi:MAG: cobyrinate a,c-diamide synthase, partial [Chloroflexota bacterium]